MRLKLGMKVHGKFEIMATNANLFYSVTVPFRK